MEDNLERLLNFLKYKGIDNFSAYSRIWGCSPTYATKLVKKGQISSKYIQLTFEKYPDLNKEWVLTGEGEMILSQSKKSKSPSIDDFLKKQLEEKDKTIDTLRTQLAMMHELMTQGVQLGKDKGTTLLSKASILKRENNVIKVDFRPITSNFRPAA